MNVQQLDNKKKAEDPLFQTVSVNTFYRDFLGDWILCYSDPNACYSTCI